MNRSSWFLCASRTDSMLWKSAISQRFFLVDFIPNGYLSRAERMKKLRRAQPDVKMEWFVDQVDHLSLMAWREMILTVDYERYIREMDL